MRASVSADRDTNADRDGDPAAVLSHQPGAGLCEYASADTDACAVWEPHEPVPTAADTSAGDAGAVRVSHRLGERGVISAPDAMTRSIRRAILTAVQGIGM